MASIDHFRAARWFRTANLLLQALLFLTLVGGLNYLAGDHPWRYDLPQARPLSAETLAYLADLPNPVVITATVPEESASPELRGLLREYAYATEANGERRITVEYLDVDVRRRRALELGVDQPGLVFIRCGANHRAVPIDELYRSQNGERAFQGELMITSAILEVSSPDRKKIYFLVGHGELRPEKTDAQGLSLVRDELRLRDFEIDTLDLTATRRIPADASLLIAVQPKDPYTAFEQELLRQYLGNNAGRLILFLAPGSPPGLQNLLLDWGVIADDDLLCDTGGKNRTEDGDLIVGALQPHPITQALINDQIPLRLGPTRTVRLDAARAAANGLDAQVLAVSSPSAWGEVNYLARGPTVYNPGVDLRAPDGLGVAVASERVAGRDNLPFSVPRGRLVVFGTGDLIANSRIANAGALDILRGAVNWTVDRDTQLSIRARPIERFQLSLSASELNRLRFCLLFGLPGAAAVLGLMVYWTRRN